MKSFEQFMKEKNGVNESQTPEQVVETFLSGLSEEEQDLNESGSIINGQQVVKMFVENGWDSVGLMKSAQAIIGTLQPALKGYWYEADVYKAIQDNKALLNRNA